MQDEINEKVIALSIRTTKLTAEMLQKSIRFMLSQIKKQLVKPVQHHGKQTLMCFCKNPLVQNTLIKKKTIHIITAGSAGHRRKISLSNFFFMQTPSSYMLTEALAIFSMVISLPVRVRTICPSYMTISRE